MNHVGNDIVDLKAPDAKEKASDIRFVQRILNPDEQQALLNSGRSDSLLWAFWAAKESAYKATSKSFPGVSSAPRRYPVTFEGRFNSGIESNALVGKVNTPNGKVAVKVIINDDFVHCIGIKGPANNLESIEYGMEKIGSEKIPGANSVSEKESIFVRNLARKHIASCLHIKEQDIQIIRHKVYNEMRPPMIYVNSKLINMEMSLSHDCRFAAYAFCSAVFKKDIRK